MVEAFHLITWLLDNIQDTEKRRRLSEERENAYQIEISPLSEKPIKNLDDIAPIGFRVRNLNPEPFPGVTIGIKVTRSAFESISVRNPLEIPPLAANGENVCYINEKPLVSGAFAFHITFPDSDFQVYWRATDGRMVLFYLRDGRLIYGSLLIHALRIMSKEEHQSRIANSISAGALVFLVVFTLYDWIFLREYSPSNKSGIYVFGMITFIIGLLFSALIFSNFVSRE